MAKAPSLRKDWTKGTQRTRKLSTGNALWRLRKWEGTLRGASGSRRKIAGVKPGAVKAASPVLNGGDEETGLCRPRLVATQLECASSGLDHGVGHFRPLIITRQRHLLAYHGTAMSHASLCQVF